MKSELTPENNEPLPPEAEPEAMRIIEEEQQTLARVLESLRQQQNYETTRFDTESNRASRLTAEYISAHKEDKYQLASDETVSHGVRDMRKSQLENIDSLLKKPYFARLVLEEKTEGSPKRIECLLGYTGNPECRIVDWRKAPLAKLYYEYKEGEEYAEEIQGREREGIIVARHKIDIEDGKLVGLSCPLGNFVLEDGRWIKSSDARRRGGRKDRLPDVLSLITPEQFRAITEDADSSVLIQGVAGSGKTTIALHRLSWLLKQEEHELSPSECAVVVRSNALGAYVETSLPSLNAEGVTVSRFGKLKEQFLCKLFHKKPDEISRPDGRILPGAWRLKQSMAMLKAIDDFSKKPRDENEKKDYRTQLLSILRNPDKILEHDVDNIISRELIREQALRLEKMIAEDIFDPSDDALFILLFQQQTGLGFPSAIRAERYRHLVIDEVQDYSPVELAIIVNLAESLEAITLAGDSAQDTRQTSQFLGWKRLIQHWGFDRASSQFVELLVSHRSTVAIMRLADYVQKQRINRKGRKGKAPFLYQCPDDNLGFEQVRDWLEIVTKKFPHDVALVVCGHRKEVPYAHSLLEPTFGPLVRIGDDTEFSFEEGIIVTDVAQVKGLEFRHVLLWNPNRNLYPADRRGRNRLYVAITRAEDNLCMVTWDKPSRALPHVHSKLLRGYEIEAEE